MPEHWFNDSGKNAFNTGGEIPILQDTLQEFLKNYHTKNTIVLHMDADLYSSTLFVLISRHQYLRKGDVLTFDDFLNPLGKFKAFSDYSPAFKIKPEIVSAVRYGRLFERQFSSCDTLDIMLECKLLYSPEL